MAPAQEPRQLDHIRDLFVGSFVVTLVTQVDLADLVAVPSELLNADGSTMAEDDACGNFLQQAAAALQFLTRPREDPLYKTWQICCGVPHHLGSFFQ